MRAITEGIAASDRVRASRGRLPRGLLGMLVLVAAVEAHFAVHSLRYTSDQALSWNRTARDAEAKARGCEILCFGDSLVKFGVLPRVLTAETNRPAFSLALLNGPPSASHALFQRALDGGATPRLVVVDFMPNQLALDARSEKYRRSWVELAGLREAFDLGRRTHDANFLGWFAANRLLPSLKARDEIRSIVVSALGGRESGFRHAARMLERNWRENRGAQLAVRGRWDGAGAHMPDDAPLYRPWTADPVMVEYVERFLRLAESRGIAVAWLLPPITRASPARREMLDPGYLAIVARMLRRFPNLVVLDGRLARYDASCYVDPVHLHPTGASFLSADLAPWLDRLASAPRQEQRWIRLSDFGTDPAGTLARGKAGLEMSPVQSR